jgi:probable F420-dependent oxidoreductase
MAIGIGLGISRFPFSSGGAYFDWVHQCEDGGVDSIWQTDRLVSSEPMLECLAAMAAIAGATKKIRFGMNVASVALRDPLVTAKQCATIDMLSGGRLLPAFGIGSTLSRDYTATGTPTQKRGQRANEALELIHRLWHEESVTFEGEFFQYRDASISPRPANPHIPLWIGGGSEVAMRRTARYGTGWLAGRASPEQAGEMVRGIKAALSDTGRSIDDDHYGATMAYKFGDMDAEGIIGRINEYVDAGCSKFVMIPIASSDEEMTEQTRLFIEEIQPAFP